MTNFHACFILNWVKLYPCTHCHTSYPSLSITDTRQYASACHRIFTIQCSDNHISRISHSETHRKMWAGLGCKLQEHTTQNSHEWMELHQGCGWEITIDMNLVTQIAGTNPLDCYIIANAWRSFQLLSSKKLTYKNVLKKMNVHNVRSLQPITCKKVRGMSYESANVVIEMIRSWSTSKLSWWHSTCTLNAKHYMFALYNYTYIYLYVIVKSVHVLYRQDSLEVL